MAAPIKVFTKLARQSSPALLLALLYANWETLNLPVESRTAAAFVRSFGIAFFPLMWFVLQWHRVDRQLTDQEQMSDIDAAVPRIKAAMQDRNHGQYADARQARVADPVARTLLAEAEAAMDAGLYRPALVTAAVALEHALRRFAERTGMPKVLRLPVARVIAQLRQTIGPELADEFSALWRVRQVILHGKERDFTDADSAKRLYDSFRWAISYLSADSEDATQA